MKLIYIATSVIPAKKANSYQVMKMCEAFACDGVDVELLIPVRFGKVREKGDAFEYYGVKKNFKIKKIFSVDLIPFEKYIGHLGFWIQNVSFTVLVSFYLLFRKVDAIYTRDKFTLAFLAFFKKKNLIWEAHNFPKKFSWVYKFIFPPEADPRQRAGRQHRAGKRRKLSRLIVISEGLKKEFVKVGYPQEKILVAPDAVDLEEFKIIETKNECREKLSLSLNKKIILYTGHLFKWKGVYTLADASGYLSDDCEIVIVGGMDEDLDNYKKYLQENNLDKVKAIGFRNHKEIPCFLKAADVLILPNSACEKISTTYTSPMKLFEYMASGRPIVVSDLASMKEILSEKDAVFVSPDDAKSLANGIKRILNNSELGDIIAMNSQRLVKEYTWQKRASNILKFIR